MAVLAGGDGNAEGAAQGAAGHADLPGVADWRMRRGILFQRFKNRYLIASYEAVAHRILGRYLGLRRLPGFRRALESRHRTIQVEAPLGLTPTPRPVTERPDRAIQPGPGLRRVRSVWVSVCERQFISRLALSPLAWFVCEKVSE